MFYQVIFNFAHFLNKLENKSMQNRFVVNGNIKDVQDVILAYELLEAEFKINLYITERKLLTAEQIEFLQKEWITGAPFTFPEGIQLINPDINEDSIVPADIKSDKTGEIRHFQNEWAVQLLTNKLWEVYIQRLDELKAKADGLTTYSKDLFEDTKSFWEQVLENKKERNITQSRLDKIKEDVNVIFDKLKTFRKTESEEFEKISKAALEEVVGKLDAVKKKVTEKANFKDLADEIKKVQQSVRQLRLTKSHDTALRKAFDDAFHYLNETRKSYFSTKNESRVAGLKEVIGKMEAGLERDRKDLEYFTNKAEKPKIGSLELQLLKVRLRQISETIQSKEEKLKDIYKTMESLLRQSGTKEQPASEATEHHVEVKETATPAIEVTEAPEAEQPSAEKE